MTRSSRVLLLVALLLTAVLVAAVVAYADVADPPPEDDGEQVEGDGAEGEGAGGEGGEGDETEGEGGEGDGTEGGGPGAPVDDGEGGEGFQNVGPGTRPRAAAVEPEFHPSYKLTYNRDQDVGTWKHSFVLDYPASHKLKFTSSADVTIRDNDVLNRVNRQESWRAGLNYTLTSAVGMGVKYNRSMQTDTRNPGESNEVVTSREKETMDFSTSYKKEHFSGIDTSFSASAGLERNSYADVESQGSAQNVSASLGYEIVEDLKATFGYSGRHSILDAKQGDFESTNESTNHSIDANFDYMWGGNSFGAGARRSHSEMQYPKDEQTEQRRQEGESMMFESSFVPLDNLEMGFQIDYSRNESYYAIETSKDSDKRARMVSGTIGYEVGGTTFSAQLRSEKNRNEHFNFQTGDTYHDSFGASVTRSFGPRLDASFRGSVALLSYHYDDAEANDQDRDLYDQEASLTLTYKPRNDITAGLFMRVKENHLIYIRTSRTGDNKKANAYGIRPSIRKSFGPRVSIKQTYELSADYTFYTYNRNSNFLIRNFVVTTDFEWKPLSGVNTTLTHKYRGQDEGSYVEGDDGIERYGKNSERDDHSLTVSVRYTLFDMINIEVKHGYSVRWKWIIEGETRRLSWEKFDSDISGKASMSHDLPDGAKIRVSVSRTLRDASNITERQEDVWNASIMLEKEF
ncbi:hypothetical protein K8S17_03640 [bacterium]|nr:hypothetical protein [bacterium]